MLPDSKEFRHEVIESCCFTGLNFELLKQTRSPIICQDNRCFVEQPLRSFDQTGRDTPFLSRVALGCYPLPPTIGVYYILLATRGGCWSKKSAR